MTIKMLAAVAGLGLALSVGASEFAFSEGAALDGSWSGGGTVTFASGNAEKASCRATYRRAGSGYSMNGVCATPSGRAAQTATLHRVSANKYSGTFHNAEYDISGAISVTVNGNTQNVYLNGSGASASIHLRR